MKRKLLACGMAMAMMLSANVFAQDPSITPADLTATGSGTVDYVDTDITVVTLPATAPNFTLDPQGVVSAGKASKAQKDGGGKEFTPKEFAAHAANPDHQGNIYGDNILQITNQGANDVEVSATFVAQITGENTVIKADDTAISNDTNNNVFMEIEVANALAKGTAVDSNNLVLKEPTFVETADNTNASKIPFAAYGTTAKYNTKGQTVKLALPGDDTYGFSDASTFEKSVNVANTGDVNPSAQAYRVTGKCNPKADWSSYSGNAPTDVIQLKVVYTVDKTDIDAKTADSTYPTSVTNDGIVSIADVAAATVTPATPTITDTETLALTFTPGYNQEVLDTTYLEVGGVNVAADRYFSRGTYGTIDAVNNTITVTPAAFTYTGVTDNGTPGTYVVKVKDTAGTEYKVTVTVTTTP